MKKTNKGFTLVELIIVIAILAIIMLIAIPNFSGIQQRMQVRADKATAAQIGKAVRVWFTDFTTDKTLLTSAATTSNYTPSAMTIPGGATSTKALPTIGDATFAAANYTDLFRISEYMAGDQQPKSLKDKQNNTATAQKYVVFLTANATDTAAKIAVGIEGTGHTATSGDTIGALSIAKPASAAAVTASYDGSAPGVGYVEP